MKQVITENIRVCGIVQGVGFRPTVYRLAHIYGLRGEVSNDGEGVFIKVIGDRATIDTFVNHLQTEPPPLAKIESIHRYPIVGETLATDNFVIVASRNSKIQTNISPDAATCEACKQEIFNPSSRWYHYPFTNCTHCGPRLSIIQQLPYDRRNTSMAAFNLCRDCQQDYHNPLNRRFHAQPTACPACGPQVGLEAGNGQPINLNVDEIEVVAQFIQHGYIVAIKGLGGFHLACDATNETAVQQLRQRKHRPDKPLALMARDINIIQEYCQMSLAEQELLESVAAPIVLLTQKGKKKVEAAVAPGQNTLGFMLPYTPLHHLILHNLDFPIVFTSGNLSDEPQCIDNLEAKEKLTGIADYFLFHNRDIINRMDDSVVRIINNRIQILRRARGYAPAPINLPTEFAHSPAILALGSELKNTFCLLSQGQAILSQHIGDLENASSVAAYEKTLDLYLGLLDHHPQAIAVDLHPEYLSTKLGKELSELNQISLYSIQHHHAHIAACLAENQVSLNTKPVLGIALDGLGYGENGQLWGGEFLLADYRNFKRLGSFKSIAMIGGEQAIYQPWRNTYAHLKVAFKDNYFAQVSNLELGCFLQQKPLQLLNQLVEKEINSPLASSCGRLFDAVAAAIGICRESCSYEGQAAMMLETLAEDYLLNNSEEITGYPFDVAQLEYHLYLEPRPLWEALLTDLKNYVTPGLIAAKFHLGLVNGITLMVKKIQNKANFSQVALSGGVFQNKLLLTQLCHRLSSLNLEVFTHSQVPTNDGGLSLGQAVITAAKLL